MSINASIVKELREKTGVGMMRCKKALVETDGNVLEAEKLLRKQGVSAAAKKAGRATGEGQVAAYVHTGGKIGAMVEVNCETDFAARSEDFQKLIHSLAMHVAAAAPRFLDRSEVSDELLAEEREIARAQAVKSGKPEQIVEKIVAGKIAKFYSENVLLEQAFIKDPDMTVERLVTDAVSRIGENLKLRRFSRFVLGEDA